MIKKISYMALVSVMSLSALSAQAAEEKVLNVYNWSDYITDETLEKFEAETGIEINYDVFDSNEVLEAKLLSGSGGYDVVVPSAAFLSRQIEAGIFMPLDKSRLSNYDNLDPAIMERLEKNDPGNTYAVPYMWGTTGFAYNTAMIEERMDDAPVNSWRMIFDPDVVSNFADCGVVLFDSPSELYPAALIYLGRDPHDVNRDDIQAAEDLLLSIRPFVRYFHNSQQINDLANGDICLSMGWSGDMLQAMDRAAEAENDVEIAYTIPAEGAEMWFDVLAIPKDAPHPNNAHTFIDFMMRPQIIADITNYVYYPNGNAASIPYIDEEITGDPSIYPEDEIMARLVPSMPIPLPMERVRTRSFTRVKSGQ